MVGAGRESLPARVTPSGLRRRSRGGAVYGAFRAGEVAAAVLPRRLSYALGTAVADTLTRFQPRRFDGLRANLRQALPEADERTLDAVVRENARNLARSWVDVIAMGHRPERLADRVDPVATEHILGPLERGRGVVIVSLHLGSWEVGLAGWNHRFGSMALLAEILEPRRLFERVVAKRSRMGVRVIPIDAAGMRQADPQSARRMGAAALRDVYRVLRSNGMVAMAIDRDLTGAGTEVPFFGAPARIPVGVVEVAIRTGAAIVPVIMERRGDRAVGICHPEIAYDPAAPREAEVLRVTGEVLRVAEAAIREHPEQWHVLDPIWPTNAVTTTPR